MRGEFLGSGSKGLRSKPKGAALGLIRKRDTVPGGEKEDGTTVYYKGKTMG